MIILVEYKKTNTMPKSIGQTICGATQIENNAFPKDHVRLSYSQAKLLEPELVLFSLDTTDKGGIRSFSKRWYRWFACPIVILESNKSTNNMKEKAVQAIINWIE